ncbi:MAG: tetratricopeptide repeat protein, partial [Pyrinomonadaceae bacterium]
MRTKILVIAGAILCGLLVVFGIGAVTNRPFPPGGGSRQSEPDLDQSSTPADRQIRNSLAFVQRSPKVPTGYNLLAAAYMQKARETGDFGYHAKAEAALKRSFEVAPGNQQATRLQAYLLLAYHRFGEALEMARRAVAQQPKDYEAHGALVDALVELGMYEEARRAVQSMIDLRPYTASFARASYLRSLYGDTEGAI